MTRRIGQIGGIMIGIVVLVFGLGLRPMVPDGWLATHGTVIALVDRSDSGSAPLIEYFDAAGVSHLYAPPWSTGFGSESPGDRVLIAYDPTAPASARLLSGTASSIWLPPVLIGTAFVIVGGGTLVRDLRRGRGGARFEP